MSTILVVANETIGGQKLLDAVRAKAGQDDLVVGCVPRNTTRHGNVIDADSYGWPDLAAFLATTAGQTPK